MHLVHEAGTAIYVPDIEQIRSEYDRQTNAFPFWAKIWPSAIAMALLLQERPALVAGKTVLELAAGLGLPSIIAAKHAAKVICSDVFPEPLELVNATAAHHQVKNLECRVIDFRSIPSELHVDTVLLSDVNYDASLLAALERSIRLLLEKDCCIVLATPQRIVGRDFINSLLPFCVEQLEKQVGKTPIYLYILRLPEQS
jgi:predicted nicotinamide N-methyase